MSHEETESHASNSRPSTANVVRSHSGALQRIGRLAKQQEKYEFTEEELKERSRNPVSIKTENLGIRMNSTVSKVEKLKWLSKYPVKVADNYGKEFPEYLKRK